MYFMGYKMSVKMTFTEFRLLRRIVSNARMKFTSETFKQFCRRLNIQQFMSSLYHHQSNRQVEACIKFLNCTIKSVSIITKILIYLSMDASHSVCFNVD